MQIALFLICAALGFVILYITFFWAPRELLKIKQKEEKEKWLAKNKSQNPKTQ